MSQPVRDRASTLRNTPAVNVPQGQYGLLTIVNGVVATHTLPGQGTITIGRARESDIQIVDPSVSRVHARLQLTYPMSIEDLDSANGTWVRGKLIEANKPVPLPLGESMEMGSATFMVQHRPVATREWRIWAHGFFEGRLEDEVVRAARSSSTFALLRLHTDRAESGEVVQQVLAGALRADDAVGLYGPCEYEILLVERDQKAASELVERLGEALSEVGINARMGLAVFPDDGRTGDKLMSRAGLRARGEETAPEGSGGTIVLRSPAMLKLVALLERVAHGDISVLILGETGTGKEVMAERLHESSPRCESPFLRLNCAALTESLLESELFGHERGAFTGAHQAKAGLLETAQGGTVFLDEIGELPMTTQVKLLRVLEERQVWRVGAVKPRTIDVRFVAATNRELERAVGSGTFRQDLYFRLNGVTLNIPPLRERREEIPELACTFVGMVAKQLAIPTTPQLSAEALDLLMNYSWPGNIRELRNAIERAVLLAESGVIGPEHFAVEKMSATVSTPLSNVGVGQSAGRDAMDAPAGDEHTLMPPPDAPSFAEGDADADTGVSLGEKLRRDVQAVERQHIIEALARVGGNQTRAAKELGISRRTLISRLEAYDIPRPLKNRPR